MKKGLASLPDLLYLIIREDTKEKLEQDPEIAVIGCAGSGKEIEKLALSLDADIILMDIEMETMNAGILATERIRDQRPDQNVIDHIKVLCA